MTDLRAKPCFRMSAMLMRCLARVATSPGKSAFELRVQLPTARALAMVGLIDFERGVDRSFPGRICRLSGLTLTDLGARALRDRDILKSLG